MAGATRNRQPEETPSYGVVLIRGATYTFRGVKFRRGMPTEVDRATRDHLVSTGSFKDIGIEVSEPEPIPVKRKGGVRVARRRAEPAPGMLTSDGGATAAGSDDSGEGEPVVEV